MPGQLTLTYAMKDWFLDRDRVLKAIGRANQRALIKAAAHIRQKVRRDILRRRKRPGRPGEPPAVHSRDRVATLRNILFAYDPRAQDIIIGPVGLNGTRSAAHALGPVPQTLEMGGPVVLDEVAYRGRWRRVDQVPGRALTGPRRRRRVELAARPFMGPGLEAGADQIPNAWAGTVTG